MPSAPPLTPRRRLAPLLLLVVAASVIVTFVLAQRDGRPDAAPGLLPPRDRILVSDSSHTAATTPGPDEIESLQTLAQIAMVGGRLSDAEEQLNKALTRADSSDLPGRYLTQTILLAWLDLQYRQQPRRALDRLDAALRRFPMHTLDPRDRPYIELADLYAAAAQPERARALLSAAERDSAAAAVLRGAGWHRLRGIVALAERRGSDAVSELKKAHALDSCTVCVLPNLALAHQLTGDLDAAIDVYEKYLNTSWIRRHETDAPHLAFSLQRLATLYQRQKQPARAAEQYEKLLRAWSAADSELAPAMAQVRAHLARLSNR